jgi:hypothetical protein
MGLLFTPKLSWTKAKKKIAAQARKSFYVIKSYQRNFGKFLHSDYFNVFDSMVKPILTNGAEIYGSELSEILEQVQIKYCKDFLGVNNSVNDNVALGECGRMLLCTNHVKIIKYWCNLLCMPEHRYPRNCYLMLTRQDDVGKINWATSVNNLLYTYKFGFVWLSQEIGISIYLFVNLNKGLLILKYKFGWKKLRIHHDVTPMIFSKLC